MRARSVCVGMALLFASAAAAGSLRLEELGHAPVPVPGVGNAELSGITWAGGTRYYAVDDGGARLCPLDVTFDAERGEITSVVAGAFVPLAGARDVEGIAWRAAAKTVLVSDELVEAIREYDPVTGEARRSVVLPPIFRGHIRRNRGPEGITLSADGKSAWIATEGPLLVDGAAPSAVEGAWVRLQRLDAALAPTGQWAYRTESGLGFVGVVDLLVAPGGELLVLERALTGGGFTARIFAIDFAGASDTSRAPSLAELGSFTPVGKRMLWERSRGFQNFEGMALGPELTSGGRLVLVVSDGDGRQAPTLLPLRLRFDAGETPKS